MRALTLFFQRLVAAAALSGVTFVAVAGGETSMRDLAFASNLQALSEMRLYEPPQLQLHHPDPAVQMLIFLNRVADRADRAERAERGLTTPDNVAIAQANLSQRAAADAARMLRMTIPSLPPLTSDAPAAARDDGEAFALDPSAWRSAAGGGSGGDTGGDEGLPSRFGGMSGGGIGGGGGGGGGGAPSAAGPANNAPMVYDQQAPIVDLSRPLQRMGPLPLLLGAAALVLLGWIGWRAAG